MAICANWEWHKFAMGYIFWARCRRCRSMLRSLTRLSNAVWICKACRASLATAFGFGSGAIAREARRAPARWPRELLGERVDHTHADVLEILDRATLTCYTMLETLGFRGAVDWRDPARCRRCCLRRDREGSQHLHVGELVPKFQQASETKLNTCSMRLEGKVCACRPARAPTRGMVLTLLPAGRNFYAVDPRAPPSQAAWRVGQHLAREVVGAVS